MLLAYVDESYNEERYWIAALLCDNDSAAGLVNALDQLVFDAAAAFGVRRDAELHGHDLFHAKRDWKPMAGKTRALVGVYQKACEAIGASSAEIIVRGIDLAAQRARYSHVRHPHSVVLEHLLECIHDRAKARDEYALVIADEIDQAATYQDVLIRGRRHHTTGYRATKLDRLVDTIHFVPSRSSRLVQAVDLVAFLHQRQAAMTPTTDARERSTTCADAWTRAGSPVADAGSLADDARRPRIPAGPKAVRAKQSWRSASLHPEV